MRLIDADELMIRANYYVEHSIEDSDEQYAYRVIRRDIRKAPTVNEWTMCFEKLPNAFEKVRACDAEGNIEEGFVEKVGKHVICKTGDHFCLDYVVAWMPLTISN